VPNIIDVFSLDLKRKPGKTEQKLQKRRTIKLTINSEQQNLTHGKSLQLALSHYNLNGIQKTHHLITIQVQHF